MKYLVTGAGGQLGSEFQYLAPQTEGVTFLFADRRRLDITSLEAVEDCFSRHDFQACINCAAYTAVDRAESEPDLARLLNVAGPENLAIACRERDIPLIHFSTDYVYHHPQNRPYREDDPTEPHGIYAQTKLAGEKRALAQHPLTMVIRTSWVYSVFGNNFVKTMIGLGRERGELRVVYDQIGAPTNARDLAGAVLGLLDACLRGDLPAATLSGVFNYANNGVCSWYDLARAIIDVKKIGCVVSPVLSHEFPTLAERPPFSLLDTQKIRQTFGLKIPYWRDSLIDSLREM